MRVYLPTIRHQASSSINKPYPRVQSQRQLSHTTDSSQRGICASKLSILSMCLVMNGQELSSMEAGKSEQFRGDSFGYICVWNSVSEANHIR